MDQPFAGIMQGRPLPDHLIQAIMTPHDFENEDHRPIWIFEDWSLSKIKHPDRRMLGRFYRREGD